MFSGGKFARAAMAALLAVTVALAGAGRGVAPGVLGIWLGRLLAGVRDRPEM